MKDRLTLKALLERAEKGTKLYCRRQAYDWPTAPLVGADVESWEKLPDGDIEAKGVESVGHQAVSLLASEWEIASFGIEGEWLWCDLKKIEKPKADPKELIESIAEGAMRKETR